jgi:O-antigen ligase
VRLTRDQFSSIAWGQLTAGLVVVPIIVTLDRRLFAEAAYIFVGLFAGLSVISGTMLSRIQSAYRHRPLFLPLVTGITVIAAAGLLLSGSRGAVIATLASLMVIPFVYGLRSIWKQIAVLVAALLLSASIPGLWSAQVAVVEERLSEEILGASIALRMDALGEAMAAFLESPLLGIGAGRYAEISAVTQYVVYPHNLILELAAEFGIFAALLVIYMVIASLRALWQLRLTDRAGAAFALASFLFVLLNAMKMGDLSSHRLLYLWIGISFAVRLSQSRIQVVNNLGLQARAHAQTAR